MSSTNYEHHLRNPQLPPADDAELRALITDQSGFMDDRLKSFIHSMDRKQQVQTLRELSGLLVHANEYKQLLHLVQSSWLHIETRADAIRLLPLAMGLVVYQPSLGMAFYESFTWVDQFLSGESSNT